MKTIKNVIGWIVFSLFSVCAFFPLQALAEDEIIKAERCKLGDTCGVPGNDGGITYFQFTTADGYDYHCDILAKRNESLTVWVYGGKNFKILNGSGLYTASPGVSIDINGRFDKPEDPNDIGQIKILKLMGGEGTVTCQKVAPQQQQQRK